MPETELSIFEPSDASHLRNLIEKVRIFERTLGSYRKNSKARKDMNEALDEAEIFLNQNSPLRKFLSETKKDESNNEA